METNPLVAGLGSPVHYPIGYAPLETFDILAVSFFHQAKVVKAGRFGMVPGV